MTGKKLREALRGGSRLYGTMIVSDSPYWLVPVKTLGLDFVFIDTEHVALDRKTLSWMCHAYREAGLPPIVRIPSPDPYAAAMVIDGGAVGLVAPYIETADQVRRLAATIKLRPLKGERLQALLSGSETLNDELGEYLKSRNDGHLFIANIESLPAMEALDDILSVEQLDAVLIGPHDLSCSMGIPEQYTDTAFIEAVEEIIGKARTRGKGAGIHMVYPDGIDQEIQFARRGANLIVHSADILSFQRGIRQDLDRIRGALGDEATSTDTPETNL